MYWFSNDDISHFQCLRSVKSAFTIRNKRPNYVQNNENKSTIHIQGAFFNCSAQIPVLKRKTLFNQRGSFVHREFHGTESLIGCPSFFHFGTENWEEQ